MERDAGDHSLLGDVLHDGLRVVEAVLMREDVRAPNSPVSAASATAVAVAVRNSNMITRSTGGRSRGRWSPRRQQTRCRYQRSTLRWPRRRRRRYGTRPLATSRVVLPDVYDRDVDAAPGEAAAVQRRHRAAPEHRDPQVGGHVDRDGTPSLVRYAASGFRDRPRAIRPGPAAAGGVPVACVLYSTGQFNVVRWGTTWHDTHSRQASSPPVDRACGHGRAGWLHCRHQAPTR